MPYLTPDSLPGNRVCRVLFVPDNDDWIAIVTGAIQELSFTYNWEKFGTLTAQQCADASFEMLNEFIDNKAGCRMIGELIPFAGDANPLPDLWLPCNGQSLLRADYPDLFAVIGTLWGSADASHFNIPDLRKRTLVHVGSGYTIGTPVGESEVALDWNQMPVHTHIDSMGHNHGYTFPLTTIINGGLEAPASAAVPDPVGVTEYGYVSLDNAGLGQAHNNVPPSAPILYLIVAKDRA